MKATIENRFEVPPDYARDWLTDFRADDSERFFGAARPTKVQRKGNEIVREVEEPWGTNKSWITIESPTRWVARGEVHKRGKVIARGGVVETVRADGKGTLHRAEIDFEPQVFLMKLMMPLMKGKMMGDLRKGFAQMKTAMEAEYNAGKPPR
jgi:hypothetical protein